MHNNSGYVDLTAGLPRPKTLVCVTDQRNCDRIIQAGRRLADLTDSELAIINVARPGVAQDPESMEYLFSISKQNNAEMTVSFSEDVARTLIQYIKNNKISYMLTGVPTPGNSVTTRIWKKFTHVTFFVVEPDGNLREIRQPAKVAMQLMDAASAIV